MQSWHHNGETKRLDTGTVAFQVANETSYSFCSVCETESSRMSTKLIPNSSKHIDNYTCTFNHIFLHFGKKDMFGKVRAVHYKN